MSNLFSPWAGRCSATPGKQCAVFLNIAKITWHSPFLALLLTAIISCRDKSNWQRSCAILLIQYLIHGEMGTVWFPKATTDQHSSKTRPWAHFTARMEAGRQGELELPLPPRSCYLNMSCRLCLGPVLSTNPSNFLKKVDTYSIYRTATWALASFPSSWCSAGMHMAHMCLTQPPRCFSPGGHCLLPHPKYEQQG